MNNSVLPRPQRHAPRVPMEFPIAAFDGMNNNVDPSSLKDTESPDVLNLVYDQVGAIQNRKGYTKLLTTTLGSRISGMFSAYNSDGTTKQLIYNSGTSLYRYNNAGGSVALTSPTGSISFTTGKQWDFDIYQNKVFGVNAADGLYQYDFTNVQSVSGWASGNPQYIKVHKNRIWMAGDPTNPSRVYFSDAGSVTSFPINNFIDVNTNDGQLITGLARYLDSLLVFKTDSIWIISGEPLGVGNTTTIGNLSLRRANSDVGCVAFRTIQETERGIILFMARSGIYSFQNYASEPISTPVNGTFRTGMNPGFMNLSWSVYSPTERKYLLGYPSTTSTVPDKMLVFDFVSKKYSAWDDTPGSCAVNFRFSQADSVLVGDPSKGIIYKYFDGNADISGDNGTATGGSTTTLVDSSKSWTTNQFVDAKVYIVSGAGQGQTAVISSNTATTLTFAAMTTAPASGSVYTIGGFTAYWKTKIFDFGEQAMIKKYKYLDLFTDSEGPYNLLLGMSQDFTPLALGNIDPVSLASSTPSWGAVGTTWGTTGPWGGSAVALFKRTNIAGNGRYIQLIFGTVTANTPFRIFAYTVQYKLKKARPQ